MVPQPGPDSDWIYGEFLSLDELRTYHGDLSQLASLLKRAILAGNSAETTRLAERLSRSLMISTAIAQRAQASLGHILSLLELMARTTPDEMIRLMDRGEGAVSNYDEDDHTLTIQDIKNSYLLSIDNFRPPQTGRSEGDRSARRAYARGRIEETLAVAANEETLYRFAEEVLRTMAFAPTLEQQLRIAETLSAISRQRPFPTDPRYARLTRERLLAEYRLGMQTPLEVWWLDRQP
jgi:hypothetical protein